jgi:hypothetical protein
VQLDKIPYLDFPELKFNEHESTQMPFRYVKGTDGNPVMPQVCGLARLFARIQKLTCLGDGRLDSEGRGQGNRRSILRYHRSLAWEEVPFHETTNLNKQNLPSLAVQIVVNFADHR